MLFNSLDFLLFFPITTLIFFALKKKYRKLFLVIASYYFYMSWKPEYALLIFLSTTFDYFAAIQIDESISKFRKKIFLILSLCANLGLLLYFKYFNFLMDSIYYAFKSESFDALDIILPVGISFYTFQTLSYTINTYWGKHPAERDFVTFSLYVCYYPQLVAGPIERSEHLLPQLHDLDNPSKKWVKEGIRLMIWGLFKKVVIADRLSIYVDKIYNNVEASSSLSLILATYFFAFQIFCDFSGYSDIARGASKMMGVDLMENFKRPYLARSVADFWSRWHISLSTWFKDYLYIPLGGNRVSYFKWVRNTLIVFLVSGIWHGANWTFVVWGIIHACFIIVEKQLAKLFRFLPRKLHLVLSLFSTFHAVIFAWIFFRANNLKDALFIIQKIFTSFSINFYEISAAVLPISDNSDNRSISHALTIFFVLLILEMVHFIQEYKYSLAYKIYNQYRKQIYVVLILITVFLGKFNNASFIYFQF